jgi:hypothetical protein
MDEGAYLICAFSVCECCGWVTFLSCSCGREIWGWSDLGLTLCVHSDDALLLCSSACKCWDGSLIWLSNESNRCGGLLRTSGSWECCWSFASQIKHSACACTSVNTLLCLQPSLQILVHKDLDLFQLLWCNLAYTHIQHSGFDSLLPTMQVSTTRSGHLEPIILRSITWKGPIALFVPRSV